MSWRTCTKISRPGSPGLQVKPGLMRDNTRGVKDMPYKLEVIGNWEYWLAGEEVYRINIHDKMDWMDTYTGLPGGGCRWECSYQHYLNHVELFREWAKELEAA